ncbi:TPA: hypothetical protein N0F65_003307 [Lagenidium giganteum]|uniref:Endonuclease n=1 Tax=Lagenidium giganteum TaxID=4803 RepID=A0AAV2YSH4_9STRA|nr:TPA: hypothetical protein N0F65_003307 [Lagenidium giganteum]
MDSTKKLATIGRTRFHTYQYRADDGVRTAGLDRWYVSASRYPWLLDTTTCIPGVDSDHIGVITTLLDPNQRTRQPTTRQVLAKSPYVRDLQNAAVSELLLQWSPAFLALHDPDDVVRVWEELKVSMRILLGQNKNGRTASG